MDVLLENLTTAVVNDLIQTVQVSEIQKVSFANYLLQIVLRMVSAVQHLVQMVRWMVSTVQHLVLMALSTVFQVDQMVLLPKVLFQIERTQEVVR